MVGGVRVTAREVGRWLGKGGDRMVGGALVTGTCLKGRKEPLEVVEGEGGGIQANGAAAPFLCST